MTRNPSEGQTGETMAEKTPEQVFRESVAAKLGELELQVIELQMVNGSLAAQVATLTPRADPPPEGVI